MRTFVFSLALVAAGFLTPLAAQTPWFGSPRDGWDDSRHPAARLWVEGERDYFRRGDRLDVRFSASDDAYVALIHVDTEGNLDFLYPHSPWDDGLVRGGRVYSLPRAQRSGRLLRGSPGIGYLYLIASPVPLDYRHFTGRRGGPWDWSYGGRVVRGDPFWAMEQITRLLLPGPYVPYAVDHYSYHVGGRYRYPSYACADRYSAGARGWGWSSSFDACDRLDPFLREHPYYYDARRYRGDRREYFRERYDDRAPRHEYKEPLERRPTTGRERAPRPTPAPSTITPRRRDPAPRENTPARRPTLERRGGERSGGGNARPAPRPASRANEEENRRRAEPSGRAAPRSRRPVPSDTLQMNR